MKLRRVGDEMVLVDDDHATSVVREGEDVPIEERDFRGDEKPLTRQERRAHLSSLGTMIERPANKQREDFLNFLRGYGVDDESRAQTTVTSGGGYLVPEMFSDQFAFSLKQADQLFDISTRVVTEKGGPFNYPVDDDTSVSAAVVNENQGSATNVDVVFDRVAFPKCPNWRSGMIRVPVELVQDSAFPIDTLLAGIFARRFSRGIGASFAAALLAATDTATTSASPSAITPDEVLTLLGSLDAAFAQNGTFMMAFSTYVALLKTKASTGGSYLIEAATDSEGYPTLFSRRVYLSPSMPAIGSNAKSISFGDHARFIAREVRNSLSVKTFVERYAEYGQVGYEAHWQIQGDLARAANSPMPVRILACHS